METKAEERVAAHRPIIHRSEHQHWRETVYTWGCTTGPVARAAVHGPVAGLSPLPYSRFRRRRRLAASVT